MKYAMHTGYPEKLPDNLQTEGRYLEVISRPNSDQIWWRNFQRKNTNGGIMFWKLSRLVNTRVSLN